MSQRHWLRQALAAAALISVLAVPATILAKAQSDAPATGPRVDQSSALVQLRGEPLATYQKTRPAPGKKIDFNNSTAKSYRAQLSALRNEFKAWLRQNAPAAKVTGEFDISLNAVAVELNGEKLSTLAAAPMVVRAEYQGVYYPTDTSDPDLAIISATQAWNRAGGPASAGLGVKVAVVDSGIDFRHPCFSDAGYPATPQLGDSRFTNNKVIAAKVFHNKAGVRDYTAQAIDSHGTHVAGTVACNLDTPATVDGVDIPYDMSGVAPAALLGNYNVFPSDVASARSEDIMNALETAYADGFDVANMSLGGGSAGFQDLLTVAVDNLDVANMVVAVAAGNSGPGRFTIESPGSAARALTAGASSVPHFIGTPVSVGGNTFGAASGDFETVEADLTAPLGVVAGTVGGLGLGCTALPAGSLAGEIAVISRGTCTFATKIRNAQTAGAVAALIVNNIVGDPTAMGGDGTPNQPTIPAYMAGIDERAALAGGDGQVATISVAMAYFSTASQDIMANFSSQGPTDVDFRVKPDVVAPGLSVLSSVPANACEEPPCFAFFNGTSMATPHLAGSAAVVRGQHPDWSAAQVRSAVVNTADQGVLRNFTNGASETAVNVIGAGRENLLTAVGAVLALDPVSVSFGAVPSGAGASRTVDVSLTNLGAAGDTFVLAVSAASGSGVAYTVAPSTLTLAPGAKGVVTVTMSAAHGAGGGEHQATLSVSAGGAEVAHGAVFTLVK